MLGSKGFTLVEVLVALFVLALGIAGAAGLQTLAVRTGQEAARLADGAQLLAALAERMQANRAAMALDAAANPYLELDYDAAAGPPPAATLCYGGAACDAAQLARFDLFEVAQAVAARYAGGRIQVCRDADAAPGWTCAGGPGAPLVARLGWREAGDGGRDGVAPKLRLVLAGAAP
ncbi:type IV pilus modification protein PilV [uncultured Massilia sp.]|uniref:type IV pilus modification protein PilV n=1 Tax=uncultured Massilia sp. TaxID=169973 RepID=UPI0025F40A69|nr:type IV pilus modification protein PilV [uncultured Massilia sp.]